MNKRKRYLLSLSEGFTDCNEKDFNNFSKDKDMSFNHILESLCVDETQQNLILSAMCPTDAEGHTLDISQVKNDPTNPYNNFAQRLAGSSPVVNHSASATDEQIVDNLPLRGMSPEFIEENFSPKDKKDTSDE